MTRIIKLAATNFKRLKAVEITPTGDLVVVSGRNGQGKTSVLDAITAALGGTSTKALPKPIRDGAGAAEIVLETEDLTITRRFTPSGSTLTVTGRDGVKVPKGQSVLDALLGKLSLDPLAFTQLDDRAQLKTLLDLVELPFDPAELDQERGELFAARTEANRKAKELAARLAGHTVEPGDPLDEVSLTDLLAEYRAADAAIARANAGHRAVAEHQAALDSLLAQAEAARKSLAEATNYALTLEAEAPSRQDLDALQDRISNVESLNAAARRNHEWVVVKESFDFVSADADDLTKQIAEIDQRKADGLKAAKFPGGLPLGFDETGVLLNGIPFKQASGAEQLRASLAMAIALNPELRVIRIADGSLLDSEGLQLVAAMATEHDCQVWIEVVSDGDGFGFMIEDGEVLDPDVF